MMPMRQGRAVNVLRGLAAFGALAGLLVGVPAGLFTLAGPPLPDHLPTWQQIATRLFSPDTDAAVFLAAVRGIGWAAWFMFVVSTLTELVAYLRGRPAVHLPYVGVVQPAAARLVATATLIFTTNTSLLTPTDEPGTATTAAAALPLPDHQAHSRSELRPELGSGLGSGLGSERRHVVGFGFNSTKLSPEAQAALEQAADDIRGGADPAHPIVLVGHTDSIGPAPYNQRLSQRRAHTVGRVLRHSLGNSYQFEMMGKGETAPLATERSPDGSDNPAGRARNRRVEITYTPHQPTPSPPARPRPSPTRTPWVSSPHQSAPPAATAPPGTPQPHPTPTPTSPAQPRTPPAPPQPTTRETAPQTTPQTGPPTASPPASPTAGPTTPRVTAAPTVPHEEPDTIVVVLRTGALVGLGLATAIATAWAATRAHQRRRRTPNPDRLALAAPPPAAPPAVAALRKAALDAYTTAGRPVPTDHDLLSADLHATPPTHITAGTRDGQPVTVALAGLNVAYTGPGAPDAARAVATELLTAAHRSRIEVLISYRDAAALLNLTGDELDRLAKAVPGLTLTTGLDGALRHLETQTLHRARLMNDHNAADLAALRAAEPGEPLPTIILITHTHQTEHPTQNPNPEPGRTQALQASLQIAERYGIGALLLGPGTASTTTCHIQAGGHILRAEGPYAHIWADAQLFHLPAADAIELLAVIRTARGADPPTTTGQPPTQPPAPLSAPPATAASPKDDGPAPAASSPPPSDRHGEPAPPVLLRVFGAVRIETAHGQITTGLRRISRDLLAYLALHPDGITRDQGIDAIAPDRDLQAGTTMFHTAINNTRTALRTTTGLREAMFINHAAGRYRLDPHLIDVDLWQLQHTLHAATHTETDTDRLTAQRHLATLFTGELADDITHEWAELERERIRRAATDTLVRLARDLSDTHPHDALTALEHAFTHDPTSEPLAQDLMRLQAHLRQVDAARRTHQLLTHHLNNLDLDPTEETNQLLARILRKHTRQHRN